MHSYCSSPSRDERLDIRRTYCGVERHKLLDQPTPLPRCNSDLDEAVNWLDSLSNWDRVIQLYRSLYAFAEAARYSPFSGEAEAYMFLSCVTFNSLQVSPRARLTSRPLSALSKNDGRPSYKAVSWRSHGRSHRLMQHHLQSHGRGILTQQLRTLIVSDNSIFFMIKVFRPKMKWMKWSMGFKQGLFLWLLHVVWFLQKSIPIILVRWECGQGTLVWNVYDKFLISIVTCTPYDCGGMINRVA